MAEMNEIKERMAKLELNQAQGSKNIEGLHSRLNQFNAELHKGKNGLSRKKSMKRYLGRWKE